MKLAGAPTYQPPMVEHHEHEWPQILENIKEPTLTYFCCERLDHFRWAGRKLHHNLFDVRADKLVLVDQGPIEQDFESLGKRGSRRTVFISNP